MQDVDLQTLQTLYGYDRWATDHLLEVAGALTQEQWTAPGTAGHGSIRDTLLHLITVQQSWCSWWNGALPADEAIRLTLSPNDYPDPARMRALWAEVSGATHAFLESLTDDAPARVFTNVLPSGGVFRLALGGMMLHVANHGTQHRSEAAAMLTAHGHSPGGLDLLWYLRPISDA